jgi:hypothetical protein
MRNVVLVADDLPGWADHPLHLYGKEFRIVIDPAGQAQRVDHGVQLTAAARKVAPDDLGSPEPLTLRLTLSLLEPLPDPLVAVAGTP